MSYRRSHLKRAIDPWRAALLAALGSLLVSHLYVDIPLVGQYARYAGIALVGLAAWYPHRSQSVGGRQWQGKALLPVAALSIWGVASTMWSVVPRETFLQSIAMLLIVTAGVTTGGYRWWWRPDVRTSDVVTIYGVFVIVLVASLTGWALGVDSFVLGGALRGFFRNPNTLGVIAALSVPLSVGFALRGSGARYRWSAGLILAAQAAVLIAVGSRTSIGGAICGGLVALLWRQPRATRRLGMKWLAMGALVGILGMAVLGAPGSVSRTLERVTPETSESMAHYTANRMHTWEIALDLWSMNPIAGHGLRSGRAVFDRGYVGGQDVLTPVHNGYVQILLELGIVGLLLFGLTMTLLLRGRDRYAAWPYLGAVKGAVASGLVLQLGESLIVGFGSVFSLPFWLLAFASSVSLDKPGGVNTPTGYTRKI